MVITSEEIKRTLTEGVGLMNMAEVAMNCIKETQGLFGHGCLDAEGVDFPGLVENIVDHLQTIIDCISGPMDNKTTLFDSQFNMFMDMVSDEGQWGDVDIEHCRMLEMWVPDNIGAYSAMLVPHKLLTYLQEHETNTTMVVEDISEKCMMQGDICFSVPGIILNTIITRKIARDTNNEDAMQRLFHAVGIQYKIMRDATSKELFDLIELVRSEEFTSARIYYERALMGDDSPEAQMGKNAITKAIPTAIDALTNVSSVLWTIQQYVHFYSAILECIPNTTLLIDAAWKRYQESFAVKF